MMSVLTEMFHSSVLLIWCRFINKQFNHGYFDFLYGWTSLKRLKQLKSFFRIVLSKVCLNICLLKVYIEILLCRINGMKTTAMRKIFHWWLSPSLVTLGLMKFKYGFKGLHMISIDLISKLFYDISIKSIEEMSSFKVL